MMEHIRIRPFLAEDIPHISNLNERTRLDGYSPSGFIVLPLPEPAIEEEIKRDGVEYLVATNGERVIGFLKYSQRQLAGYQPVEWRDAVVRLDDSVHIEKVCVAAEYRRSGVASRLYSRVVEAHSESALYTFIVVSPCANTASLDFHASHGFRRVGRVVYEVRETEWILEELLVKPGLIPNKRGE